MFINSFTNINFGCSNFAFGNFGFPNFGLYNFNMSYNNPFMTNGFNFYQPSINCFNMSFTPSVPQNFVPNFTSSFGTGLGSSFGPNLGIWNFSNTQNIANSNSIFSNTQTTYQSINLTSNHNTPPQTSTQQTSYSRRSSETPAERTQSRRQTQPQAQTGIRSTQVQTQTNTTQRYTGSLSQYNPEKGNHLAEIAMRNAGYKIDPTTKKVTSERKDPQKFTRACARYVQTSLTVAGLDDNIPRVGSAYQMTASLRNNNNFTEISSSTNLKDLPPGTVIVYNRGVQGYSSVHGHVEIITKDGRAVSDGITDNLYKKPSHIFIPV